MRRDRLIGAKRPLKFESLEPRLVLSGGVYISEFMAANTSGLRDKDGAYSDWIEVYNSGTADVNLNGWCLTDDDADLDKWRFPAVNLPAGQYLVVFASQKDLAAAGAELHTNFKLSSAGEYLALVQPDGVTVASEYAPAFPPQFDDISYGVGRVVDTKSLVSANSPAKILVPTSGVLGSAWSNPNLVPGPEWGDGTTGIGFESSVPGFAVSNYVANLVVDSLATAESVIITPGKQSAVYSENAATVNYVNTGDGAHFLSDRTVPGFTINVDRDDYVIEAKGTVTIPAAGDWTFGVNSDDGFGLNVGTFRMEYPNQRGPADTFGTFTFPAAGDYPVRLVMYERGGGSEVELYAAKGGFTSYAGTDTWRLVGDTAAGGLAVVSLPVSGGSGLGFKSLIGTDVETSMRDKNATAYVRVPFNVADVAAYNSLTLRMKYDDGFVAYLNGYEIARRNAPATPAWNSPATAARADADAVVYEEIDATGFLNRLRAGANVLAIQGLNQTAADDDFLVLPELVDLELTEMANRYFDVATPGSANSGGFFNFVADTKFDRDRGFYTAPFDLSITTDTAGAVIRYTTNGSAPTATTGTVYTGPLTISKTTTLRAAAFKPDYRSSEVDTQTYIFLDDVIRQPANPVGFPTNWNGTSADYEMDPDVVNNALYKDTIKNDLMSIPTMSIVMNVNDLFGPSGIYSNPTAEGVAWERPGSTELIYPDGTPGFQINNGVRIYGGVGRDPSHRKHTFRLFFKSQYGPTKLHYPLFGDGAVESFDSIILRSGFNNDWIIWNQEENQRAQYARDEWVRTTQLAMGQPSPHTSYVHLYVNGLYWGLYNPSERPDAAFAASYLGGAKEEYDAINSSNVVDGDKTAWNAMMALAQGGLASDAQYQAIQQYLDVPNLIDYMILNFYGGNWDWDNHNWYAARRRVPGAGYQFYSWDAERTLEGLSDNRTNVNEYDKPSYLYAQLRANAEFRLLFADHVQKHFFNNGALTPAAATARYTALVTEIDRAIVGESARWGDSRRATPYTRNAEWLTARNGVLQYFPQRTNTVLGQLRTIGLYPSIAAPSFNQFGGTVPVGFNLKITGGTTIYYTDDGTDPRLLGGAVAPTAKRYTATVPLLVSQHIMARVQSGATWSALTEATFAVDTFAPLRVTEVMYNPPVPPLGSQYLADDFEFVELLNTGSLTMDLAGVHFASGITFDFTGGSVTSLAPGQYVLVVRNAAAFATGYDTTGLSIAGEYTGSLSNSGELLSLEGPLDTPVLSFTYGDGSGNDWPGRADGNGSSLELINPALDPKLPAGNLDDPTHWRSSSEYLGTPGAAGTGPIAEVVINEVLSHTDLPQRDAIELLNVTDHAIDISGWYLSDSNADYRKFQIPPGTILAGGGYRAFDETDFNPTPGLGTSFAIDAAHGEDVYLLAADDTGRLTRFVDKAAIPATANGESYGRYPDGTGDFVPMKSPTLGAVNGVPRVGPVVLSEIMYRPKDLAGGVDNTADEFLRLTNITGAAIGLANWFDTDLDGVRDAGEVAPWKLDQGVDFEFASTTTIPAYGSLVVVSFNPAAEPTRLAAFRAKYGVDAGVEVVGPWDGKLDNGGETIRLRQPDSPPVEEPGFFPLLLVEEVRYDQAAPWPSGADGTGASLARLAPMAYGNDPSNWMASYVEVIVDNKDAGFSTLGTWLESTAGDEYAASSVYANTSGATATWTPNLPQGGRYDVYAWWSRFQNGGLLYDRDSTADYTITHAAGTSVVQKDQDVGYGQWTKLGTFDFAAGAAGSITLSRGLGATAMETTSADAVRLVRLRQPPPTVVAANVNNGAAQRTAVTSLALQFSSSVAASLDAGDLALRDESTGQIVELAGVTPTYDPVTNTATWNLGAVTLADGYYRATLAAAGVTDAGRNPLDGDGNGLGGDDYAFTFFRLSGDITGDAAVDIFDVAAFQTHYGMSGATPSQGDLDGDGDVDIFDVAILQVAFGGCLSAPAPGPAAMPPAAESPAADAAFADTGWNAALPEVGWRPASRDQAEWKSPSQGDRSGHADPQGEPGRKSATASAAQPRVRRAAGPLRVLAVRRGGLRAAQELAVDRWMESFEAGGRAGDRDSAESGGPT
ncbi:MAG: lamin tail domain-containing protein [Pirellulales bacterium]